MTRPTIERTKVVELSAKAIERGSPTTVQLMDFLLKAPPLVSPEMLNRVIDRAK